MITYEIRRWCEGETRNLKLHVADPTGRIVLSSANYDEVIAERDRLNAGGAERQTLDKGNRSYHRQPDGSVLIKLHMREVQSIW